MNIHAVILITVLPSDLQAKRWSFELQEYTELREWHSSDHYRGEWVRWNISHIYLWYMYNSVLTCRQNIINSLLHERATERYENCCEES